MNAGVIVEVAEPTFRSFVILALFHAQIRVLRLLLAPGPAPSRTAGKARERAQDAPDAGGTRPYIHIYNIWVHTALENEKTRLPGLCRSRSLCSVGWAPPPGPAGGRPCAARIRSVCPASQEASTSRRAGRAVPRPSACHCRNGDRQSNRGGRVPVEPGPVGTAVPGAEPCGARLTPSRDRPPI